MHIKGHPVWCVAASLRSGYNISQNTFSSRGKPRRIGVQEPTPQSPPTWRSCTCVASTKFTIAAAQSTFTWGWSQQDSNLLVAPKQAAARSLVSARGLVAVERFLSAAEHIASPSSSPERAEDERHLWFVFMFTEKGARLIAGGGERRRYEQSKFLHNFKGFCGPLQNPLSIFSCFGTFCAKFPFCPSGACQGDARLSALMWTSDSRVEGAKNSHVDQLRPVFRMRRAAERSYCPHPQPRNLPRRPGPGTFEVVPASLLLRAAAAIAAIPSGQVAWSPPPFRIPVIADWLLL